TFAFAVPVPFCTLHVSPAGCVSTLTLYGAPPAALDGKLNDVAPAATATSSPKLFCSTSPALFRPLTVPPTVKGPGSEGKAPLKVSRSPPRDKPLPGRAHSNAKPNAFTASVRYADTSTVVLPTPRNAG